LTKNNKLVRKAELAYTFTQLHLAGKKGPSRTKAVHGKDRANRWCYNRSAWYNRNEKGSKSSFRGQ
jgi:hypothetical protein